MSVVDVNGAGLEMIERGTGHPVVLVHGSASDHRTWQAQLDGFSGEHRVIAYSRRYHRPNARIRDDADYSMLEHVDDLRELLTGLRLGPVHLVGHSYGAFVALLLAIRDPARVRTLALTEPPALTLFTSTRPRPAELLRVLLTRPRAAVAIFRFGAFGMEPATRAARRGDLEAATRVSGRAVLGRDAYDRLSEERLDQARDNTIAAEFTGSGFPPLPDADVRGVRIPTLLVGGARSPAFFARILDRLEELLPHAERVRIEGASHIVHEDQARAYNEAVLDFLGRHEPS